MASTTAEVDETTEPIEPTEPVPGTEPTPTADPSPTPEPAVPPESPSEPATEPGTPEPAEEPAEPEEPSQEPAEPSGPQPDAILSEKDVERTLKAAGNEATRHANRLTEIFGEDAVGLVPCELCPPNLAGFRWNVAPNEEVAAKVRAAIGLPTVENLKPDTYSRRCDSCDGSGKVTSGSLVSGQETLTCYGCKGKGWLAVGIERGLGGPAAPVEGVAPTLEVVPDDGIKRDVFGTPEGDPDYGKMPNMRSRPIEYWQQHQGQGQP